MKSHPSTVSNGLAGLTIIAITCMVAGCGIPTVSPMIRVGEMDIDGNFNILGGGGIVGASSDANSLGLEEETLVMPRLDIDWGNLHLTGSAIQAEYDGSGIVEGTLNLGGVTIPLGTDVTSDFDFDMYTAYLTYDLLPVDFLFDLGIGGGVGYLDYDVAIQSTTGPERITSDDDLPFGFLTARVAREIGRFEIVALVSGLGIEFDDDDLSFYDLDAYAGFRLFGEGRIQGHVMVGYRAIGIDYEWEDDGRDVDADADFQGPYVGFKLRF
jgi:hypothetical protein